MEKIWLPFGLLLAIWGVLDVILKTIEMQNEIRDEMRDQPRQRRMEVFRSDWIWLWLGSLWFLAVFTTVTILAPVVMALDQPADKYICWLAASMPGVAFFGLLIGGGQDLRVFIRPD